MVTALLTDLLKGAPKRISVNPAAEKAFKHLKQLFSSAPILKTLDPTRPFWVEVDTSEVGTGAVLSQKHGARDLLHPCAYYSRKLTAVERNYDIANRELLAIQAALNEWRHWLEGTKYPFIVLTDHRNLEYMRSAKWLNLRQARWSLFFSHFDFTITYCPGSKNVRADALSRMHAPDTSPSSPTSILPADIIVSPVAWEIDTVIQQATRGTQIPAGCPSGSMYVPSEFRMRLI